LPDYTVAVCKYSTFLLDRIDASGHQTAVSFDFDFHDANTAAALTIQASVMAECGDVDPFTFGDIE